MHLRKASLISKISAHSNIHRYLNNSASHEAIFLGVSTLLASQPRPGNTTGSNDAPERFLGRTISNQHLTGPSYSCTSDELLYVGGTNTSWTPCTSDGMSSGTRLTLLPEVRCCYSSRLAK